jgi:hypothetical protein
VSNDGTAFLTINATTATGFSDGTSNWVRATIDVNDGAGNRVTKFYTSSNGTTWTQLGTTVTTAGTTTIFDGTAVLEFGSLAVGTSTLLTGTIGQVIIQSAFDTGDNTTSVALSANFATQTADAFAFAEASSNAATVTINTTRYSYGVPSAQISTASTYALTANVDYYAPFIVTTPIAVDLLRLVVNAAGGPASNAIAYAGIYAADNDFQPTGSPLVNTSIAVSSAATGIFTSQVTPVTLQPGAYVASLNVSVAMTVMTWRGGLTFSSTGVATSDVVQNVARTAAAFTSSPSQWNSRLTSNTGYFHLLLLRWKAA